MPGRRLALWAASLLFVLLCSARAADTVTEPVCAPSAGRACGARAAPRALLRAALFALRRRCPRVGQWVPGANGVPLRYMAGILSLARASSTWAGVFCGGRTSGCADRRDWPGPGTVSPTGWARVRALGAQLPAKEWGGAWWRGNELGTVINNPYFYASNRSRLHPPAAALGITPRQHAAIRPLLEHLFGIGASGARFEQTQRVVEASVRSLLAERARAGKLTHTDLRVWVHQALNAVVFGRAVSRAYALRFVGAQRAVVRGQVLSQLLPAGLYRADPLGMDAARLAADGFAAEYRGLLDARHGAALRGGDCAPTASCLDQTAYAVLDAFLAAGGLSVPASVLHALAVVFSTDASNPAGGPLAFAPGDARAVYWEALRAFPPVVVLPYWAPRPLCAGLSRAQTDRLNKDGGRTEPCPRGENDPRTGFPKVNQYQGGKRFLPNIVLAQRDPAVWGEDADVFKIRPLEHYHKYSLGFAEMAVDPNTAGGRMNRVCPGKELALLMGSTFLRMFKKNEWIVHPDKKITIKFGPPYVKDFDIFFKDGVQKCRNTICKCRESSGFFSVLRDYSCRRCTKSKCLK